MKGYLSESFTVKNCLLIIIQALYGTRVYIQLFIFGLVRGLPTLRD
jgi:hypothetical protein